MHVLMSCKNHMLCSKCITTFCLAEPLLIDTITLELSQANSAFFLDSLGLQTAQPTTACRCQLPCLYIRGQPLWEPLPLYPFPVPEGSTSHKLAASVTIIASGSMICECHLRRLRIRPFHDMRKVCHHYKSVQKSLLSPVK